MGGIGLFHWTPGDRFGAPQRLHWTGESALQLWDAGAGGLPQVLRLMQQAEKFGRPIPDLLDTPGAYPAKRLKERGQGEAIARCMAQLSGLTVPVIAMVTGEGSSGGALALGVANRLLMLENAVYSVLSPEGFASILWKDASRSNEACEVMKLTAQDLADAGIVDEVIPEPLGCAARPPSIVPKHRP